MGILNITSDSFFDGGKHNTPKKVLLQVEKMIHEGATIIDIGAYSTRPGNTPIPENEELKRITKTLALITQHFPETYIAIDTFRSSIAKAAIDEGAIIINDISGGLLDPNMYNVIAKHNITYILMHMRGTPQTMNKHTQYENLLYDIIFELQEKIFKLNNLHVHDIIVDPGFGFAKTLQQNFDLLSNLHLLKTLDCPLLVGISRKSMIYKTLNSSPDQALNGSSALHMYALCQGASILRVHDVKEAAEVIKLYTLLST